VCKELILRFKKGKMLCSRLWYQVLILGW